MYNTIFLIVYFKGRADELQPKTDPESAMI